MQRAAKSEGRPRGVVLLVDDAHDRDAERPDTPAQLQLPHDVARVRAHPADRDNPVVDTHTEHLGSTPHVRHDAVCMWAAEAEASGRVECEREYSRGGWR